jgi:hypothetical protein
MNSKMNLERAIEIYVAAAKKARDERPTIVVLDKPPKAPELKDISKICEAINMDGKKCKLKINPEYKCYCTRHGKKT